MTARSYDLIAAANGVPSRQPEVGKITAGVIVAKVIWMGAAWITPQRR